jgi:hypothetical protein
MRRITLPITTAADGSATVNANRNVVGVLFAILYQPGTIATGATIVLTCQGKTAKALLTKASAGTVDTTYYPRDLSAAPTDGSALTSENEFPLLDGAFRVVVSAGGNGGVGSITFYFWDD